ncbi:lef-6 [Cryptophlebia peltastica nucleopolyhedrovirus]|uniref:Lef-6 n=1 Tax=Cryptophlebia peltastica nucleopolyhedrovirus TaxID=2304025 RepID=A0A346RNM9_9ABAC|nr:lef-6 [Cryptophlebia peltastica nucleopolyhedrovirus]AXS67676.1 lef-6 [Cryptophlebia peltastica nucleopolyhedrovirus]
MYIFHINGTNYAKRFTKEFLNHVCGGRLDIDWDSCTRKKLILHCRYTANRLLNVNRRVYWPSGEPFKCYLVRNGFHNNRHRVKIPEKTPAAVETSENVDEDWYENGSIIDVEVCEDDIE